jgi:hypothetical protein
MNSNALGALLGLVLGFFIGASSATSQCPPQVPEVAVVTCTAIDDAEFTDDFPGYICPEGFYPV